MERSHMAVENNREQRRMLGMKFYIKYWHELSGQLSQTVQDGSQKKKKSVKYICGTNQGPTRRHIKGPKGHNNSKTRLEGPIASMVVLESFFPTILQHEASWMNTTILVMLVSECCNLQAHLLNPIQVVEMKNGPTSRTQRTNTASNYTTF